jgi:hypothetical protein
MYISPTPLFFLHIKKAEMRRKSEERKRCSCTWVLVSFSRWFAITPSGTTKSSALTIFAAYLTLSTLHPLFKQPLVQQVFRAGILLSLHVTQVLALAFRSIEAVSDAVREEGLAQRAMHRWQ